MPAGELWTIGHSTLSSEDFVETLRSAEVDLLVDVRSLPGSRHNPQFDRETMEVWLPDAGVGYRHLAALGGRRRNQDVGADVNAGWQNASFHNYADYTLSDDYEAGLDELFGLTRDGRVAIMCAEAVPWRCHRSLIANTLVARGWAVHHLMPDAKPIEHELGRWGAPAVVGDDERVRYPPEDD